MKQAMTPRGFKRLKDELSEYKAKRSELADAIEIARAHGDLSENADYDAAKNASGMNEARIRDLESRLSQAQVIDPKSIVDPQTVVFGSTVKILDLDSDEEKIFSIYGEEESDVSRGWISYQTPLARALVGKMEGDVAIVKLPAGVREYEILDIHVSYED